MSEVLHALHRAGLRMTSQRQRVLAALERGSHLTPDEISEAIARDGGPEMPSSTVYRTLEALQGVGIVEHTHLDHGPPTYHLAGRHGHVHLVCRSCGAVLEVDEAATDGFAAALRRRTGFVPDITHMAIHGRCAACADKEDE